MRKCSSCGRYTLKDRCPDCGGEIVSPHPPRFSPDDPYGKYRRQLKREVLGIGEKNG